MKELKLPMAIRETTVRPEAIYFRLDVVDGIFPYLESETVMNQTQQCLRPSSRTSNGNGKSMPYLWRFTCKNLQQMRWVSEYQAPDCCKNAVREHARRSICDSVISGYRIAPCCSEYGGVTALVGESSQKRC